MSERNYYELLGVVQTAPLAEITRAFDRTIKKINDRNAPEKLDELRLVIEAFAILSNEQKRADYDRYLESGQALLIDDQLSDYPSTSLVERIRFESAGGDIEHTVPQLIEKVGHILKRVQDHTVRLRYRGQQIGPDIPMHYAIALEALGLLGAGVVRTVVANLGVKTLFEVEMVSHSEEHIKKGDESYQKGDLDQAEQEYLAALKRNERSALACLRLGILKKIQAHKQEAADWFRKAISFEPSSEAAHQAQQNLDKMM
ncbi:DnaJ domain-containing protein [bacterium]|nr:DnaJ domain-containing protein [bacterium]